MLVCTGPTAGSVRCACLPKLQTRLFWAVAKQSLFLWWLHLPCVDQPITKCSRECGRNPADLPSPFDQLSPMASQEKRSGKRASVTDPETRVAHCFLSSSSIINQSLRCAGGKLMDSCGFEWRQGIYLSISLRQLCMRHSWGHTSMLGACAGEERRRLVRTCAPQMVMHSQV